MISRSTLVGALVVAELVIVSLAFAAFAPAGAPAMSGPVAFGSTSWAREPGRLERTFVSGLAPHVILDVRGVDVTIETHAQPLVDASESLQTSGWVSGTIPPLAAQQSADGIRIVGGGDGPHFVFGGYRHAVRIAVPALATVEVLSARNIDAAGMRAKLTAHTPEGDVRVRDHRGDLDVSSSDGKIELTDVQGDDIAANTHDGRLYLTRVDGRRIDAHTNFGRIYAVDVTAQDGALSTHFGRISASFTGRSDSTVAVSTRNKRVSVSGLPSEALGSRAQTVRLGAGRGRFEVSTDDGAVNISEGASS